MKKLMMIALSAVLLAGCMGNSKSEQDALQRELDSLRNANAEKDSEMEECFALIDQVNEGFRVIKEAEGQFDVKDGNIEANKRNELVSNMEFVQNKMKENRELIDQLKKKISGSNSKLQALMNQVNKLEADYKAQSEQIQKLQEELAARDVIIEQQTSQINNLNENVNNLTTENEQQSAEIAAQDKALNKAWFVFGTKKELKDNKILDSGEVLQNSNFNKSYFTEIDIRYVKDIKLESKSAKLLSNHPSGSYELAKNAQGLYELHITNPTQFWSVSKYLVVLVK